MKFQITLICLFVVYCSVFGGRIKRPNCDDSYGKTVDGFSCGDGQCIWLTLRCDGKQNCYNRFDEDETLCNFESDTCTNNEFKCDDGKCISTSKRCDNKRDCDNGGDEKNCDDMYVIRPNCDGSKGKLVNGVDCGDGQCIFPIQLCNGVQDCFNKMDESQLACPDQHESICTEKEFQCGSTKECILLTEVCDGTSDCVNNADEHKCPGEECPKGELTCGDGVCYATDKLCDGNQDCFNNSDEKHCTTIV